MDSLRWLWGAIRTDAVTDVETGFCGPDDRPWGATIVADPAGAEPQEMGFRQEKHQVGRRRDPKFACVCETRCLSRMIQESTDEHRCFLNCHALVAIVALTRKALPRPSVSQ